MNRWMRDLESFVNDGERPIVFTLGSSAVRVAGEFYSVAAQAARRLNRRAVLVAGCAAAALREGLPPSMTAVEWTSYPGLFSRAAAVVHQGGVGTTAQALRAGVPQLVIPFAHDQFDNAERVHRLGCGRIPRRDWLLERSLARELQALLADDGLAAAAREEGRHIIRPFRWSRLFWTYVIPVAPLVSLFDGLVSCLRTYSAQELRGLTEGLDAKDYQWEIGELRSTAGPIPITYLIGVPKRSPPSVQA